MLGPAGAALGARQRRRRCVVALACRCVIGLFSLRVQAIFFAMITLAVASRLPDPGLAALRTHRRRGRPDLQVPRAAQPPALRADCDEPFLGVRIDGRLVSYYLLFVAALVLVLLMLRIVNSPFGRVLQAIRENDFRAEAIGYRTVVYRTAASALSALFATLAGALLALWLRYTGPDTTLSFEIMIDVLLIVVIGGMGTMYGAVVGATLFVLAQNYLQDLMALGARRGRRPAAAGRAGLPGPLAAVAGPAVRAARLLLPGRHRRPAARPTPTLGAERVRPNGEGRAGRGSADGAFRPSIRGSRHRLDQPAVLSGATPLTCAAGAATSLASFRSRLPGCREAHSAQGRPRGFTTRSDR